ncbi:unnamed protein product [Pseudo-nitzschia multistriata]|uniref:Uncharacterized protein n=1 Tax=Pseudo-nitzschia multistriata TaxID=183589 RepID=A0A448ZGZ4_9STRA|nr:unnamed protein product [Pseudo-nitzschia multistriata]
MSTNEDSPSAKRRKALKDADSANQLRVLESCPLSKYADIAERLLGHFQNAVDGRRLDEAYVFGLRFANLCISGLPQHPEWRREIGSKTRKRLTSQVGDVLSMMDVIKQRMDAEELMKIKAEMMARKAEELRKKEEEDRRNHEFEEAQRRKQQKRDALEKERAEFLAEQRAQRQKQIEERKEIEKRNAAINKKKEIEQSAMAKLKAMQARVPLAETKEEQSVAVSETNVEKPSNTKAKPNRLKNWFGGGKDKSSKKKNEEKSKLSAPSGAKDSDEMVSTKPTVTDRNVATAEDRSAVTTQEYPPTEAIQLQQPEQETSSSSTAHVTGRKKGAKPVESVTGGPTISRRSNKSQSVDSSTILNPLRSMSKIKPRKNTDSKNTKNKNDNEQEESSANSNEVCSKKHVHHSSEEKPIGSTLPSSSSPECNEGVTTTSDVSSTAVTMIPSHLTPLSRKEQATIHKLQRAITVQEDRLEEIEGKQIPQLLERAKVLLKEKNKQEALKCLVHKKRLERQVDAIKAAVFNMETQMFMLESAFEDRHVKKALDEAASAIAGYQQIIGDPKAAMVDLTNMSESLPELDVGESTDEELMEELTEWLTPEEKKRAKANENTYADKEDLLLLSMPEFLPAAPADAPEPLSAGRAPNAVVETNN